MRTQYGFGIFIFRTEVTGEFNIYIYIYVFHFYIDESSLQLSASHFKTYLLVRFFLFYSILPVPSNATKKCITFNLID
jgi:hypothetical protein